MPALFRGRNPRFFMRDENVTMLPGSSPLRRA
jgi:hypothetical protein